VNHSDTKRERIMVRDNLLAEFAQEMLNNKLVLATAESCTGGGIANWVTEISGSSAFFDRGLVTYSNQAKHEMLGVKEQTLEQFGAVSEQTAIEMVSGALTRSAANVAVSVTGIAGPTGAVEGKPVGTVCFGLQFEGKEAQVTTQYFDGDRAQVREQSIIFALQWVLQGMKK
jgi:nicotinamide-nucleotide amidase